MCARRAGGRGGLRGADYGTLFDLGGGCRSEGAALLPADLHQLPLTPRPLASLLETPFTLPFSGSGTTAPMFGNLTSNVSNGPLWDFMNWIERQLSPFPSALLLFARLVKWPAAPGSHPRLPPSREAALCSCSRCREGCDERSRWVLQPRRGLASLCSLLLLQIRSVRIPWSLSEYSIITIVNISYQNSRQLR